MNLPDTAQPNLYRQRRKVRFSDCDPAGMVFFPRYLSQMNDLVEDWFDDALGIGYADFITTRGFGPSGAVALPDDLGAALLRFRGTA